MGDQGDVVNLLTSKTKSDKTVSFTS